LSSSTKNRSPKKNVVAQARGKNAPRAASNGARSGALWETIKSIGGAVIIYLVIRTLLVEAYRIPSGSMIPTLLVGDWLFVNKLVYGPTIPFTNAHLPGYSQPKRNDVVVFVSPPQSDQPEDPQPTLVKRLVGMPGDTLYMRGGLLYVNGLPQRQGFAATTNHVDPSEANSTSDLFAWQHRIEVKSSRFGSPPEIPTHDNWGPLLIPAGNYFMMGDNRYCSKDSRYWGVVPRDNVRGRPLIVYYSYRPGPSEGDSPVCNPETSDRPLSFITDIRWGRIGDRVR
jgi:signal peptidase I